MTAAVSWQAEIGDTLRFLPTVLGLLAAIALALAIRTSQDMDYLRNAELPFALTVIAIAFAVACIRTNFYLRKSASPQIANRSALTAVVIFGISMIAIWGGSLSLFGTFTLCNQEYLHWIPITSHTSFSVPISSMIAEYALVGTISSTIGGFLFWYLFFQRSALTTADSHPAEIDSTTNP